MTRRETFGDEIVNSSGAWKWGDQIKGFCRQDRPADALLDERRELVTPLGDGGEFGCGSVEYGGNLAVVGVGDLAVKLRSPAAGT